MTDREKIITIVQPYVSAWGDDERLADALIENGYGNVAEWKRRTEVAEKELERYKRALYNISRRYELMSGFSENEADLFELTEVRIGIELDVADKEIEEERK